MTRSLRLLALLAPLGLALGATACVTDDDAADDIDDAIDAAELADGKADGSSSRHYFIWHPVGTEPGVAAFARAGGGLLRCPDGIVRDFCDLDASELELGPAIAGSDEPDASERIIDELEEHSMIARGRLVRDGDRIYIHATALTRAITEVIPVRPCYRIRPFTEGYGFHFEKLDTPIVQKVHHVYLDEADPTPDFWGQATPAVQAKIDAGLAAASTRPVYTCGMIQKRGTDEAPDNWFWGSQLFVPNL